MPATPGCSQAELPTTEAGTYFFLLCKFCKPFCPGFVIILMHGADLKTILANHPKGQIVHSEYVYVTLCSRGAKCGAQI